EAIGDAFGQSQITLADEVELFVFLFGSIKPEPEVLRSLLVLPESAISQPDGFRTFRRRLLLLCSFEMRQCSLRLFRLQVGSAQEQLRSRHPRVQFDNLRQRLASRSKIARQ